MGQNIVQMWWEYEFIKLRTFLLGYYLHIRGIENDICERSRYNLKMKSTVVCDKNVWDMFLDHFNNKTFRLQ